MNFAITSKLVVVPTAGTVHDADGVAAIAELFPDREVIGVLANDPAESLRLLDLDQRLHARGGLVEERDALRVQSLTALGRRDEARELAARFIERYPHSVHRKTIERVIVEAP